MQTMIYCIATRRWDGWLDCVHTWRANASRKYPEFIVYDKNVLEAYQECWLESRNFEYQEPILAFIHDDCKILEQNWDLRVLKEFQDPQVGLVGFAGGIGFGSPNLYRVPYKLEQLGRWGFRSNMKDAERHGAHFAGECDGACLDGFAMFVRRNVLDKWGGWIHGKALGYFVYDMALSAEVRKQGLKTRIVGVACEHLGGKTASMMHLTDDHAAAHKWLFHRYRSVLPFAVTGG
jgi:hypothetical protein